MFQQFIAWMLGPSGMKILQWYIAHGLLINGPIVLLGLLAIVFPRQRQCIVATLREVWDKSPLAASPEDREAIARAKERYRARRRGKEVRKR